MAGTVRAVLGMVVATMVGAGGAGAQEWSRIEGECRNDGWRDRDRDRVCETRTARVASTEMLEVDAGQNGGIDVVGWSEDGIQVEARVFAVARSEARARELAAQVRVRATGGRVSADGPRTGREEHWGVTFHVSVPRTMNLELRTHNGGISVEDVRGDIRFDALNGGVRLVEVGGDVRGETTNGGLHIELGGDRWVGEGMDVETVNGGVDLVLPDGYSARLITGTVNGGIDLEFPVTVQGRIGRRLETTLGEGGPLIRAVTINGGVDVRRGGRSVR